ncbi:heparinase II/III domain-containing protein [Dechloromonas sp. A34]|uniref:heparinase II/III domain-containing protein n=1 Tax=Dechloromonas sp. A34 TaxID=447588 RepID=UPI00224969EE|nr:heparinase II/III family protein [Dechloromonas sp. A34]
MSLAVPLEIDRSERPETARKILGGQFDVPVFSAIPVKLLGWPQDLQQDGLTFQLVMASLALEDLLLEEYERTNKREYYIAARERILSFSAWEEQQRKPTAFLWNDHAIAARTPVLIRLWNHLRADETATDEQRINLIALVTRSGGLLAKDSHFTVRTNHGVMQNLALLQISAAFPSLPQVPLWRSLAINRLELQLGFYVSKEGVVLEHSAEYHILGTELLAYALRLIHLNGLESSKRLLSAAQGTSAFARKLLRPDGSLPLFGNTVSGNTNALVVAAKDGKLPVTRTPPPFPAQAPGAQLLPLSGYALWWNGEGSPSQTLVAWANHKHHGHKHADEPSLHFWSRGYDWITASGYWPYDQAGYAEANGWPGSNAPHVVGETTKSPRSVRLVGSSENNEIQAIDIENQRDNGLRIRRQIVQLSPERLLVLDIVDGAKDSVETFWTIDRRLTLRSADQQHFMSTRTDAGDVLHLTVAKPNNQPANTQLFRGNRSPFAGWVVVGRKPSPASTLRVEQVAPQGITATLISVSKSEEFESLAISPDSDSENWTVLINEPDNSVTVVRRGKALTTTSPGQQQSIVLMEPPSVTREGQTLRTAMNDAIDRYPHWRDLGKFRQRLYITIPILWVITETAIALLSTRRRWPRRANLAVLLAWATLAWWLHSIYLR